MYDRVCLDARALQTGHAWRGIGVYVFELLKAMLDELPSRDRPILLLQREWKIQRGRELVKQFDQITTGHPLCSSWLSDQLLLPLVLKVSSIGAFHSLAPLTVTTSICLPYVQPVPTIATVHDLNLMRFASKYSLARRTAGSYGHKVQLKALSRAHRIIVPSAFVKREIETSLGIDSPRIVVAHHGCPTHISDQQPTRAGWHPQSLQQQSTYALFVGEGRPKNLETCLRAMQLLPPEIGLVVVGKRESYKPHIVQLVEDTRLRGRVLFFGWIPGRLLATLYANALCFLFPSYAEGFGFPVLEAMQMGCPVICSDSSSLPEIAGSAAVLVHSKDHEGMAAIIGRMLNKPEYRQHFVRQGRKRVLDFSWSDSLSTHVTVYEQALSSRLPQS